MKVVVELSRCVPGRAGRTAGVEHGDEGEQVPETAGPALLPHQGQARVRREWCELSPLKR
jgi:hypothetical protein